MIKAILVIVLLSGGKEVEVQPKHYDSIVSCQRAAKANVKAMAIAGGDIKIKSATCKPVL